jgi:hypothetical protein
MPALGQENVEAAKAPGHRGHQSLDLFRVGKVGAVPAD